MPLIGWYYLHENGSLIFKRDLDNGIQADLAESPFVRSFWPVHDGDREDAWTILVEASALNAKPERIAELVRHWRCNDDDADEYAKRANCVIERDGNAWCAHREDFINLQESPAGFGDTKLAAMAALCKELGFTGRKIWTGGFRELLKVTPECAS